jgi:oxygen-independent coproporphyrinogen-3 oxidase
MEQALQAVDDARRAGFDNLNIDLIYGLPGQGLENWRRNLEQAVSLKPEHISLYALSLEPDCPMALSIAEGRLPDLDADLAADMYEQAEDILSEAGYRHYEISNWARPGFECRHNLVYWHNQPYLGAGVAAHSLLDGHRLANTDDLDVYINTWATGQILPPVMDEVITPELRLAESVILGLRLEEGVAIAAVDLEFGTDILGIYRRPIEEMTEAGLLEQNNGRLKLTRRGRLLSNEVFWRLLPEKAAAL